MLATETLKVKLRQHNLLDDEHFKKLIDDNALCELGLILESLEIIVNRKMIQGNSNKEVVKEFIEEYERMERLYDFNYDEYLKEVERTGIDLN